jgi:oxygen-dependent protoporphyrinogen oxidase
VKHNERSGFLGDEWFAELARAAGEPTLTEYFGEGFASNVVRHTTVRMNGAEPDEAWLANFGTNLALVVDKFDQLTDGLEPVMDAAAAHHRVHLGAAVERVDVGQRSQATIRTADGREHGGFDAVVLAVPAPAAANLVEDADAELAALLRTIHYHPVAVVVAVYDRPVFPQDYAAIAVHGLPLSNAGSYGLEDRNIVRYTFSGRPARAHIAPGAFEPEQLLGEAEEFLARYVAVDQARRQGFLARLFEPGLCAYRPNHFGFLQDVERRLERIGPLALAGDYMRGASLEACTRSGIAAADRIAAAHLPMSVEMPEAAL